MISNWGNVYIAENLKTGTTTSTPQALAIFSRVVGNWEASPRGANYRQITIRSVAQGGTSPYEFAFSAPIYSASHTLVASWPYRAGRTESFYCYVRDAAGTVKRTYLTTPAMTT